MLFSEHHHMAMRCSYTIHLGLSNELKFPETAKISGIDFRTDHCIVFTNFIAITYKTSKKVFVHDTFINSSFILSPLH